MTLQRLSEMPRNGCKPCEPDEARRSSPAHAATPTSTLEACTRSSHRRRAGCGETRTPGSGRGRAETTPQGAPRRAAYFTPTLRRAVAALPWAQVSGCRRRQAGHGRTESRSIKVLDLDGHPVQALFPHAKRAIKVVRRRRSRRTGKQSTETVYAVTSLDYRHADPGLLAVWIQGHGGVDNRV